MRKLRIILSAEIVEDDIIGIKEEIAELLENIFGIRQIHIDVFDFEQMRIGQ